MTTALSAALAPAPPRAVSAVTRAAGAAGLGMLGVFATLVAIGTFIGGALGGHWFSGDGTGSAAGSEQWTTINGTPTVWINGGPSSAAAAHDSDLAFLGWISGFALLTAVLLFVLAARLAARFRAAMVGRPAAEAVWSRAWYCARCGSVHFPPADGDPTEALSLQQFRALVWEAGGYGALVAQHPAV
ncbi:hypothetical protein [Kitasatospora sp. CMC57]|uniref:hypothetical protein n=1 Tax=Kitasatospora sp. CMC57 TaxID=3231513 RepID=UPI0038B44132